MVKTLYIPDRGDVIWMTFDPVSGHEQGGRRPAYVLTSRAYNKKLHMMLTCPITKQAKNYPGEIPILGKKVSGVLLVDQIQAKD